MLRIFKSMILMIGVIISMVAQAKPIVRYDIKYEANYMECAVSVNGKRVFNTADYDFQFPELFNYRHGISQYINQGVNTFNVKVADVAYFLRNSQTDNAYCRVSLIALTADSEEADPERHEVFSLNFKLKVVNNDQGESVPIVITEGSRLNYNEMPEGAIKFVSSNESDIFENGSVIITYSYYDFMADMNQYAKLSWIDQSTPIQDTVEIREKAVEKYKAIQIAIEGKNWDQLKSLLEPGLSEMAALQFMARDEYFDVLKKQLFDNLAFDAIYGGWKADVFQPENYKFGIYAGGKLFNFYHLRNNQASPVNWERNNYKKWFSPTLTLINGEVKVGAF